MNQAKTKLQLQVVDTKKDPIISASSSLALNLVNLKVNNDWVNDNIYDIKTTKRKTNAHLLSNKEKLKKYGDVFDTFGFVPGKLHLEVEKSIQPLRHVPRTIPVAMKEEIKEEN